MLDEMKGERLITQEEAALLVSRRMRYGKRCDKTKNKSVKPPRKRVRIVKTKSVKPIHKIVVCSLSFLSQNQTVECVLASQSWGNLRLVEHTLGVMSQA